MLALMGDYSLDFDDCHCSFLVPAYTELIVTPQFIVKSPTPSDECQQRVEVVDHSNGTTLYTFCSSNNASIRLNCLTEDRIYDVNYITDDSTVGIIFVLQLKVNYNSQIRIVCGDMESHKDYPLIDGQSLSLSTIESFTLSTTQIYTSTLTDPTATTTNVVHTTAYAASSQASTGSTSTSSLATTISTFPTTTSIFLTTISTLQTTRPTSNNTAISVSDSSSSTTTSYSPGSSSTSTLSSSLSASSSQTTTVSSIVKSSTDASVNVPVDISVAAVIIGCVVGAIIIIGLVTVILWCRWRKPRYHENHYGHLREETNGHHVSRRGPMTVDETVPRRPVFVTDLYMDGDQTSKLVLQRPQPRPVFMI